MTTAPNAAAPNSQGATVAQMSQGETSATGNPAPVVNNAPPPKEAPAQAQQQAPQNEQQQAQVDPAAQQQEAPKPLPIAKIGDPSADAAVNLMNASGMTNVDANRVFGKAFETGKLDDIDAEYLKTKVGVEKAALILAAVKEYNSRVGESRQTAIKAVYEVSGGQENWNKIRAWAKSEEAKSDEFRVELDEYRKMLDMGGRAAKAAAEALRKAYESNPANPGLNNTLVHGDGGKPQGGAPITNRAEYLKLVKAAHQKGDLAEVARIDARRAAGRNLPQT